MANWVVYNTNGLILYRLMGTEPSEDELSGNKYIEVVEGDGNSNFKYVDVSVDPPVVIPRPTFFLIESANEFPVTGNFTVSRVPVGATLYHPDGETIIDDGEFEWDSALPGEYYLHLSLFPYLDKEWVLEVTNT